MSKFRFSDGTPTEYRFDWMRRLILAIRGTEFTEEEKETLAALNGSKK